MEEDAWATPVDRVELLKSQRCRAWETGDGGVDAVFWAGLLGREAELAAPQFSSFVSSLLKA
jgi:hypothetical protein